MADHGNRQIARVNDSLATKTTLADRYDGKRLNSPNDLAFDPRGNLYFTDPKGSDEHTPTGCVYRVETGSRKVTRVASPVDEPVYALWGRGGVSAEVRQARALGFDLAEMLEESASATVRQPEPGKS